MKDRWIRLQTQSGRVIWIVASKGEPGGQTIPANVLRFQSYDNVTTRRCMCAVSISSKRVLKARLHSYNDDQSFGREASATSDYNLG